MNQTISNSESSPPLPHEKEDTHNAKQTNELAVTDLNDLSTEDQLPLSNQVSDFGESYRNSKGTTVDSLESLTEAQENEREDQLSHQLSQHEHQISHEDQINQDAQLPSEHQLVQLTSHRLVQQLVQEHQLAQEHQISQEVLDLNSPHIKQEVNQDSSSPHETSSPNQVHHIDSIQIPQSQHPSEIRWTLVPLSLLPTYYQNLATTYITLNNNNGQKIPNGPLPTSMIPPPGIPIPPSLYNSMNINTNVLSVSPNIHGKPSVVPTKFNNSPVMNPGISAPPTAPPPNLPILYRNVFHLLECRLPVLGDGVSAYDGYRVFIDESVGYSGNAKLFKSKAEAGERALILACQVLDPEHRPLTQCSFCKEYFSSRMYFKTNPHIRGRIVLIKNNQLVKVENAAFSINVKFMCCCKHHYTTNYILSLSVKDNLTDSVITSASVLLYVKQWRKSTQKKNSYTIKFDAL